MSIIGRGDVAQAITDKKGYTYFATGISNRTKITDRDREIETFKIWNQSKIGMFVYISTLSVYYSESDYTRHKRDMEELVRSRFDNYCIFRIGNITWGSNPNTIINFLKDKIKNNEDMEIHNTSRYLIDKSEFTHWIDMIPPTGKHEMNCTGTRKTVSEIVEMIKANQL